MRLYEHEAKLLYNHHGIPTPRQLGTVQAVEDLDKLDLSFPCMLKAMVLVGGRGKAGGIKKANDLEEARAKAKELLGLTIKGYPVETLLLEEAVDIQGEIYLSVTTDPATFDMVLVTSASGGVDIEEVARTQPDAIWKKKLVDNPKELPGDVADEVTEFLASQMSGLAQAKAQLRDTISAIYACFQKTDAKLVEINPLVLTSDTERPILAADAKFILDDNALYRQAETLDLIGFDTKGKRHDVSEQTTHESRAYKNSFPYVDLLDNPDAFEKEPEKLYVGLVPGGAGYGIFSIDEVVNVGDRYFGGKVVPINFMDSGGGPPVHRVAEMFHLLMDHPLPDMVVTSRFGGISSCDVFIRGLIQALRDRHATGQRMIPVYGRMVGTDLPSAREAFEKAKQETPEPLKDLHIVVGNQKIMADVIRDALEYGFKVKENGA